MAILNYLTEIEQIYKSGIATEHAFRANLQNLVRALVTGILVINEPKRQECGSPDFVLIKNNIPVGYIEAKDIGDSDLEGVKKSGNKEQFDRYKSSLNNLIFTDYLRFYLYRDGEFITKISIAEIVGKSIKPLTENFTIFKALITDFCSYVGQTIKDSKKLAEIMAGKARLLSYVISNALTSDEDKKENSTLKDQIAAFKQILIHDITPKEFADIYAQTIAYGMFAARLHDPTLQTFSRQEAYELIPDSNPFLKKLFGYIAGLELDERIVWIVDDLVNIFLACNVEEMLYNYKKNKGDEDPIIHFYEDFLKEYDPKLRKSRGVWYTPTPVVNFITRAVDDILKEDFNLKQGLADTSKTIIKIEEDNGKKIEQEVHRVQILDPATGTGTFLAEVIKQIYKKFEGQQGIWSSYVETHLLPRLNGFELLMASYAMAHLKLDLLLRETGYLPTSNQRFRVFLTNSLEEQHPITETLFARWLSNEANEANRIKRDTPVMCVIGNPPYSGESANKGEWIERLIDIYKHDHNGKKIPDTKWLNNDYVKFLRYGQYYIEKNGSGVLAFITDNSFLDSITFRGMRWNLLKTYDKIYILNLHGNSLKKETAPDGSIDQNVFDIMQGTSISLFVKTAKKKDSELAKVYHYDLYGKREEKYDFLLENCVQNIKWQELKPEEPNYFLVPKDFSSQKEYDTFIKIDDLLDVNGVGICSKRDETAIKYSKKELFEVLNDFKELSETEIKLKYKTEVKESRDKKTLLAKQNIEKFGTDDRFIKKISYRPFDIKWTYFTDQSRGFLAYPVYSIMKHFTQGNNVGLVVSKQSVADWRYAFITKNPADLNLIATAAKFGGGYIFPLYFYPDTNDNKLLTVDTGRTPNLNLGIVDKIAENLGLRFVNETSPTPPKEGLEPSEKPEPLPLRIGYITANSKNYRLIKEVRDYLKKNPTEAEKVMWEHLRNKKTGYKIRRQHIIDDFITDFVCLTKKVVIEIDGKIHEKQKEYDELRTAKLNELEYDIIRFTNEEVFANPQLVVSKIKEILDNKPDLQNDADIISPPLEGSGEVIETDEVIRSDYSVSPPLEGPGEVIVSGEVTKSSEVFAPIDLLDYIYAVLHSPKYREKYKEFLKIDFPRVPYPKDKNTFWQLVKLGGEIRQIHLLESPVVENFITKYTISGDNTVSEVKYINGKVYINDLQYFENVPQIAWEFYIGGYQPAQKWLKDRRGRNLSFEDILHYQKIIVALSETDRLMKEIDKVKIID
jgi:very-short-patch-repair endonuclease